jgi:hypothetical protein
MIIEAILKLNPTAEVSVSGMILIQSFGKMEQHLFLNQKYKL